MKKRLVTVILALTMVLGLLAGCNGSPSASPTGSGNNTPTGGSQSSPNPSTGEIKKVILAFPTWTGAPPDTAEIQAAMNAITRDAIGIEVELLITDFASFNQQMTLMLTGNEQLDIFCTISGLFMPSIQNGQLLDLEEDGLFQTYGKDIPTVMEDIYINACRVGGVLYGLPNNRDMAQGRGCAAVRTDLLQEIGYTLKNQGEIERISIDELNDIYARIHEKHPEMEIYRPAPTLGQTMQQFSYIDALGGSVYGVLDNYGAKRSVDNLFELDAYRDYCARMRDYHNKGYISMDATTDTTAVTELVKAGTLASYTTGGKPGIKAQETLLCDYDMTIFQTLDDYISSSSVASFPWAIPRNTADPVAAMTYLNMLYTNADLMNLISWGIEGKHYEVQPSGLIDFPAGVDASNSGYNPNMGWMFPNQFLTHIWVGNDPELWNQLREFNNEAQKSSALGFSFDSSGVATEWTAVQNIYTEYWQSLEFGMVDPDVGIPEMVSRMEAAGLTKIIYAKQAQLDQWAADMGLS